MSRAVAIAVMLLVASAAPALAEDRAAYVDEVVVAGGPGAGEARDRIAGAVRQAGLQVRFAAASVTPCGEDPACLAVRGRAAGAVVALRVTIAEVAGEVIAAVLIVDVRRGTAERRLAQGVELADLDGGIAAALARHARAAPRRRVAAWSLTGAAVLLAAGGAAATWRAHDLRDRFFADHVDANGDVFGISPAAARAAEVRARRWSLAGGLLLAGAASTGVAATVLFVRGGDGGEVRPAGLAVAGRF
jgi:hypothetical protein